MLGYQSTSGADTPWDQQAPPRAVIPPGPGNSLPQDQATAPPGPGTPLPGAVHAGRYAQQAGGTHPTGMHSCIDGSSKLQEVNITCILYNLTYQGQTDKSLFSKDAYLTTKSQNDNG